MIELIKNLFNLILKLLGLYNPKIEGEDAIDKAIENIDDKLEEIDDQNMDANELADAINNDK